MTTTSVFVSQKPAQPVNYEFIPVGKNRCYIYNNGRLLGRVDIENGQAVEYPEANVMWLPKNDALAAMKGLRR